MQRFNTVFLCCLLWLPMPVLGQSFEVDVMFSDRHRPHVQAVSALTKSIRADDVRLFPILENGDVSEERKQLEIILDRQPDLLVVVGEDALQAVVNRQPPMPAEIPIVSLLSMSLNDQMQQSLRLTGIDLRPPAKAVADALAHLLPKHATILSYYNPDYSQSYIHEASDAFRHKALDTVFKVWPKHDVQAELHRQMKTADAYWMQLEYQSVQPDTLRLLFVLAKHGKRIIGLSAKYVRAGAMLAWSPQLEHLGEQAGQLVNRVLAGESPVDIAVQHPDNMTLSIQTPDMMGDAGE